MGLLDSMLGGGAGQLPGGLGGAQSPLGSLVASLTGGNQSAGSGLLSAVMLLVQQNGGLGNVIAQFEQKGLGSFDLAQGGVRRTKGRMLQHLLIAAGLVALTVAVHASGFGVVLGTVVKQHVAPPSSGWAITWLLIRLAWVLMFIHMVEISLWALFYRWQRCLPDVETAFYFSGVTYTTLGYGDLVLPLEWRLLAPLEGLTGILMCGLSAGLFFATVTVTSARDANWALALPAVPTGVVATGAAGAGSIIGWTFGTSIS